MTTPVFADDFTGDGPVDPAKWTSTGVARVGGVASVTTIDAQALLSQVPAFDLRGRSVTVEVKAVSAGNTASVDVRSVADGTALLSLQFRAGAVTATLSPETGVAKRVAYNPAAHSWVQFTERAGSVTWAVGAARTGPWSVLRSAPTPAWAASARVVLTGYAAPAAVVIDGGTPTAPQADPPVDGGAAATTLFTVTDDGGRP